MQLKIVRGAIIILFLVAHLKNAKSSAILIELTEKNFANNIWQICDISNNLTFISKKYVSFTLSTGLINDRTISFLHNQPINQGAISFMLAMYDAGKMDVIVADDTEKTVSALKEYLYYLSYSTKIKNKSSLNLAMKYLTSEIAQAAKATLLGLDADIFFKLEKLNLSIGILNLLMEDFIYENVEEPSPTKIKISMSYNIFKMLFFGDFLYLMGQKEWQRNLGFELALWDKLKLRGCYLRDTDVGKLRLGIGLAINRLSLDYVYGFTRELNPQCWITLKMDL